MSVSKFRQMVLVNASSAVNITLAWLIGAAVRTPLIPIAQMVMVRTVRKINRIVIQDV